LNSEVMWIVTKRLKIIQSETTSLNVLKKDEPYSMNEDLDDFVLISGS